MSRTSRWTRRRFLAVSSAAAAASRLSAFAQTDGVLRAPRDLTNALPDPTEITGGTLPLLEGHTARPLRYTPEGGDFVIRNGREFFNRPIYGVSSAEAGGDFRVDAGDLPEFSLYLPGHGGNLKLGFIAAKGAASKWAAQADEVIARYRPGRMIYEVRDALLGSGALHIELVTSAVGQGMMVRVQGQAVPAGTRLAWAFGGVSGKKGRRNGDIGCEVEPVAQFFQVRPEECTGNVMASGSGINSVPPWATLHSPTADLTFNFPLGSILGVSDFEAWQRAPQAGPSAARSSALPILAGSVALTADALYIGVQRTIVADPMLAVLNPGASFAARIAQLDAIAGALLIDTPDAYLNASGPALAMAAETVWDQHQQCVLHGGVAWRVALAGWRGPYSLDALGRHDRAQQQFRHWIARQNVTPVDPANLVDGEATGPADPKMHLARKEGLLHTNGDLSHNHYDMNLVFFDVLLRHLRWTGDLAFAREIWPAFERHLAWERRLFRREYVTATGTKLPLYEAYAAIWASDNLQYNGGGTAHASAYNLFALRTAAALAKLLGHDPTAYATEAALLERGMNDLLWLPQHGIFAESKDILGPKTTYTNPATWTVYHTLDSEAATPRQAWQMVADQLHRLRSIPVHGPGVPSGNLYMLACSDWLPYVWSLTLLVLAENLHMALALWQAGMPDAAYGLFKGNLLDSMYMGLCPGDFHMSSALDPHRQEAQRDFADPIGVFSRALIEGLFGVRPNLIAGTIDVRPGFPAEWDHASLAHKDFDFSWRREGMRETYTFKSRLPRQVPMTMTLPARTTHLPQVTSPGGAVRAVFDTEAVGRPVIRVELPPAPSHTITIVWSGNPPALTPVAQTLQPGEAIALPAGVAHSPVDDPQDALADGLAARSGHHIVFANVRQDDASWTMPIAFHVISPPAFTAVPALPAGAHTEPLSLALRHQITQIFTRPYAEPRSPFCSLAIPEQLLGGWANLDGSVVIDDAGLRGANGTLATAIGVPFHTPAGSAPNCLFLSHWQGDAPATQIPLNGRAFGIYLLVTGTTHPQCSRMQHASATVTYTDGTSAMLALRNPETWWPIEQDYLLDDYIFVDNAPLPPRVDLRTGRSRLLDRVSSKGKGRAVPGGAATILHLALDPAKELAHLRIEVDLYAVVVALLAATLIRA